VTRRQKLALIALGTAQFLMVLDTAVMNVSISTLVEDFDTTVSTIQGVITTYTLVMAAFMITGGKLGDMFGRKRIFAIGMVIYACGSALTAASWSVGSLLVGWSFLEGMGAALVMPAMAALVAGNFKGPHRAFAYGVLGGLSGAGIAVGPIVGGWVTTNLSWRYVFIAEVVIALGILAMQGQVDEQPLEGKRPNLDVIGAVLSALGMILIVFGFLMASGWGWLHPIDPPFTIMGLSPVPFVTISGLLMLAAFSRWQRYREDHDEDPLIHMANLKIPELRSALITFLGNNTVLMGIFFALPLYLQIVLGLDAFQTGLRMLPISITMLISSILGPKLSVRYSPRTIVMVGFSVMLVGAVLLGSLIEPTLDNTAFFLTLGLIGIGMGLPASQLGNVALSSVTPEYRSEAGGLQYTSQQLGSSLGTAVIGSVVLSGLASALAPAVTAQPSVSAETSEAISNEAATGVEFVPTEDVQTLGEEAGLPAEEIAGIVESYEAAQLFALQTGIMVVSFIIIGVLFAARKLPNTPMLAPAAEPDPDPTVEPFPW
jgi:EmrB/QacA subfamily drug resistance transporter